MLGIIRKADAHRPDGLLTTFTPDGRADEKLWAAAHLAAADWRAALPGDTIQIHPIEKPWGFGWRYAKAGRA